MSEVWHSAAELAAMKLPGLPTVERALRRRAQNEGWESRKRNGRGGGSEYPISALPAEAQAVLAAKTIAATPSPTPAEEHRKLILADAASLTDEARQVMEARLFLLGEVERLRHLLCRAEGDPLDGNHRRRDAQIQFAKMAAQGELTEQVMDLIAIANRRSRQQLGALPISDVTLRRWLRHHDQHGEVGLIPQQADSLNPAWLWPFMAYYRRPSKPSIRQAHEAFAPEWAAKTDDEGNPYKVPPYSTVCKVLDRQPEIVKQQGRMGPRELKSIRAYTVRGTANLSPADVYTADGHCADFEVAHPFAAGQVMRPEIISVVDIKTRVCVGWAAGLAESSQLVTDALRAAAIRAIPAIFYVDRGAGFKNDHLKDVEIGILARLGTSIEHSLPYNSQARGTGERFHKSVWNRAGRDLPTFVGADMDPEARQKVFKKSRAELAEIGASSLHMPWDQFIAWGHEVVAAYNARPHGGLPKIMDAETGKRRHMAPLEAWAAAVAEGWAPDQPEPGELDAVFRAQEKRRVTRCQVRLYNHHYFSKALDAYHGREVRVGYDLHNASNVSVKKPCNTKWARVGL